MTEAIKTCNLTKKYKNKTAVDAVNLSVEKGEIFSLLGVNGAGKTTLIKMLSCLIRPTSGEGFLLGESITKQPKKIKEKINVSPQETAVAANLTVEENLIFLSGIYGKSRQEAREHARRMIELFQMESIAGEKAKRLSGGWQRRLSIAMAMISEPKVLFLDEPTLGLDILARRELWNILKSLRKTTTIILTTHYLEEAEMLSDRVGIMTEGKLVAVSSPQELVRETKTGSFEEAFLSLCGKKEGSK